MAPVAVGEQLDQRRQPLAPSSLERDLAGLAHRQHPLYPLPPFATGANMTFRPGVLQRIGGFDPALGAGTPASGSEDTLAFSALHIYGSR